MELLHNLLQFLLEQMNYNIEFIYNKYGDEFKQSSSEFDKKGETPRQFEIYKKYEEIIESDLQDFCKIYKYDRFEDLILDIQHILDTSSKDDIIEELELFENEDNIFTILEPSPDDIVNIIVDLSSYTTFSTIMRNKCSYESSSSDCESYEDSENDENNNSHNKLKINNYIDE